MLRHVVMFGWKPETPPRRCGRSRTRSGLAAKIPQIAAFEWGTDVSVQGFSRGFTHCFVVPLPPRPTANVPGHPDHQAFLALSGRTWPATHLRLLRDC